MRNNLPSFKISQTGLFAKILVKSLCLPLWVSGCPLQTILARAGWIAITVYSFFPLQGFKMKKGIFLYPSFLSTLYIRVHQFFEMEIVNPRMLPWGLWRTKNYLFFLPQKPSSASCFKIPTIPLYENQRRPLLSLNQI